MFKIAVAASKGGVGKSTITAALAVEAARCGLRVAALDADTQRSLTMWMEARGETLPKSKNPVLLQLERGVVIDPAHIRKVVREAERSGFDLLLIDTPPALMTRIKSVVALVDLCIVPVRPSPLDLQALDPVIDLCEEASCRYAFLVNANPPRSSLTTGTVKNLSQRGDVFKTMIGYRTSYPGAMITGLTAAEIDKGDKAEEETRALWKEVKALLDASKG